MTELGELRPRLGRTAVVAVDGPSGSGKSTYATALAARLGAFLVATDHFATWEDPVAWWPELVRGVLEPLGRSEPGGYRRVDWSTGSPRPGDRVEVPVCDVLVIEGVSAGRRSVGHLLSALVWIEVSGPEVRLDRAAARDGEHCRAELAAWQRFEAGWFAVDATADRATHRPIVG